MSNFHTETKNFHNLMGNGSAYSVPKFQRDYSWGDEQLYDLWQDIIENQEDNSIHYMGYIVLQRVKNDHFYIIDGQQRLTTLSILILSILKHLESLNDADSQTRMIKIRETYIGAYDYVSLTQYSKLTLNRNNDQYYQNELVGLKDIPHNRHLRVSEKLMRKAFIWFQDKLKVHIKDKQSIINFNVGEYLAEFIKKMTQSLVFSVISVQDDIMAYKVFETLNARGVKLSSNDLLKNYLFSILAKDHDIRRLEDLEIKWDLLSKKLLDENFSEFLRYYWLAFHEHVRNNDLFKKIRENITESKQVFELIRDLDKLVEFYTNILKPDNETDTQFQLSAKILKLFSVKQFMIVMLPAYKLLPSINDVAKLLEYFIIISFRYHVISQMQTNDLELFYVRVAKKIADGTYNTVDNIIYALKDIYISDKKFIEDFKRKQFTISKTKLIRYILCKIENSYSKGIDYFNSDITIEHIMPQNQSSDWGGDDIRNIESYIYSIGNLTILEKSLNKNASDSMFSVKRNLYKESSYKVTRDVAEKYDAWSVEMIEKRQSDLANMAKTIWRISQYD